MDFVLLNHHSNCIKILEIGSNVAAKIFRVGRGTDNTPIEAGHDKNVEANFLIHLGFRVI